MSRRGDRLGGTEVPSSYSRDVNGVLDRVYSKYRTTTGYGADPAVERQRVRRQREDAQALSDQLDALRALREQAQETAELRGEIKDLREQVARLRALREELSEARTRFCAVLARL
jgi:hypothetical protein